MMVMTRTEPAQAVNPALLAELLSEVECSLQALGQAVRSRDADRVAEHAQEVHRALAPVVDQFGRAARQGQLPPALKQRLVRVGREVAGQRLAIAPQQMALDRALALLMPAEPTAQQGAYRLY